MKIKSIKSATKFNTISKINFTSISWTMIFYSDTSNPNFHVPILPKANFNPQNCTTLLQCTCSICIFSSVCRPPGESKRYSLLAIWLIERSLLHKKAMSWSIRALQVEDLGLMMIAQSERHIYKEQKINWLRNLRLNILEISMERLLRKLIMLQLSLWFSLSLRSFMCLRIFADIPIWVCKNSSSFFQRLKIQLVINCLEPAHSSNLSFSWIVIIIYGFLLNLTAIVILIYLSSSMDYGFITPI